MTVFASDLRFIWFLQKLKISTMKTINIGHAALFVELFKRRINVTFSISGIMSLFVSDLRSIWFVQKHKIFTMKATNIGRTALCGELFKRRIIVLSPVLNPGIMNVFANDCRFIWLCF